MTPARRGLLVLGMHRSGTSAAARAANLLGLEASVGADLMAGPAGDNARGHWESTVLVKLNTKMLHQMGCRWYAPPRAGAAYALDAARVELDPARGCAEFDAAHPLRPWVSKDPRTCTTVPFWRRAFADEVACLFVYRNPLEVAGSLAARDHKRGIEVTTPLGVALWERYNRLVLEHTAGLPVYVASYEDLLADPAGWCTGLGRFLERSGLLARSAAADPAAAAGSVDGRLRHQGLSAGDVRSEWPAATMLLETLDGLRGGWDEFATPELPPEPASVEERIEGLGRSQAERAAAVGR